MRWWQIGRWVWWWQRGVPPRTARRYLQQHEPAIARWLRQWECPPDLERVSQELSQLRYQLSHEADREQETLDALRLCRAAIDPGHCPECRAAASVAELILSQRDAERSAE